MKIGDKMRKLSTGLNISVMKIFFGYQLIK